MDWHHAPSQTSQSTQLRTASLRCAGVTVIATSDTQSHLIWTSNNCSIFLIAYCRWTLPIFGLRQWLKTTDKAAFSDDVFIIKTWSRPRLYIPLISRIHFSDPASIMDDWRDSLFLSIIFWWSAALPRPAPLSLSPRDVCILSITVL